MKDVKVGFWTFWFVVEGTLASKMPFGSSEVVESDCPCGTCRATKSRYDEVLAHYLAGIGRFISFFVPFSFQNPCLSAVRLWGHEEIIDMVWFGVGEISSGCKKQLGHKRPKATRRRKCSATGNRWGCLWVRVTFMSRFCGKEARIGS